MFTKVPVKMRYVPSIADAPRVLEKALKKQQGLEDVKVDADTSTVTFTYTGPVRDVKKCEAYAGSAKIPARLLNPAVVEFDVKGRGNAKAPDLEKRIEGMVGSIIAASNTRLEFTANLETVDWAELFKAAGETGFTLKPKSHAFMTYEWSEGGDAAELAGEVAKLGGMLVVKGDEKKLNLIGDAKADLGGVAKLMKARGFTMSKTSAAW